MTAAEDYCDFCDLPRSTCIHGRPPAPPPSKPTPKPKPRAATPPRSRPQSAPTKVVPRRWTPPEKFAPLILSVLRDAGGELDAEDLFLELEILLADELLPGDHEKTPEGELRWRYAARRARLTLVQEGLMTKGTPGVWRLAPEQR